MGTLRCRFPCWVVTTGLFSFLCHAAYAETPQPILSITSPVFLSALSFSPNSMILAGGTKGQVILWNDKGDVLQTLNAVTKEDRDNSASDIDDPLHEFPRFDFWVKRIAFSPDNRLVAATVQDSGIKVWEVKTGKLLYSLFGHQNGTNSIIFSPSGKILASGGNDHNVCLWDLETGQLLKTLVGHSHNVIGVAYSADGNTLTSLAVTSWGTGNGEVKMWNVSTGQVQQEVVLDGISPKESVLSKDGRIVASASNDNISPHIGLWNARTGSFVRFTKKTYTGPLNAASISSDDRIVAAAAIERHRIYLYSTATGESKGLFRTSDGTPKYLATTTYSVSANSSVVAVEMRKKPADTAATYSTVEIWPIKNPGSN